MLGTDDIVTQGLLLVDLDNDGAWPEVVPVLRPEIAALKLDA